MPTTPVTPYVPQYITVHLGKPQNSAATAASTQSRSRGSAPLRGNSRGGIHPSREVFHCRTRARSGQDRSLQGTRKR